HRCLAPRVSTLSLHDALPIWTRGWFLGFAGCRLPIEFLVCLGSHVLVLSNRRRRCQRSVCLLDRLMRPLPVHLETRPVQDLGFRSEEHTSELQSRENLVCRLL